MSNVQKRLELLSSRVEKLVILQEKLVRDNQELRNTVQKLQSELELLKSHNQDLTEKNKLIRLSQAISTGEDQNTRELKLKINEYIREIDRCLTVMNT